MVPDVIKIVEFIKRVIQDDAWVKNKFLKFILPKSLFQRIEEESKNWFIECGKCGFSKSYWESGGIRAYTLCGSKTKWVFGYCPNCKKYKLFKAIKKNKTSS